MLSEKKESPKKIKNIIKKILPIDEEPFIGIWKDRMDMEDSVSWVKNIRQNQMERISNGKSHN